MKKLIAFEAWKLHRLTNKQQNFVNKRIIDKEIIKWLYIVKNSRRMRKLIRETSNTKR